MKRKFRLVHKQARSNAIDAVATAPDEFVVTIEPPKRTGAQNDIVHALLTEVGNEIGWKWNGFDVDLDDLKSVFMAAFRKTQGRKSRILPGVDGEPVLLGWRTRDLTKKEASEFLPMVYAWLDERRAG